MEKIMNESLSFLTEQQCFKASEEYGTPLYIYSYEKIEQACREVLDFPAAYGLTVRYALKANPLSVFLKIAERAGVHFDASSEYEAFRCLELGIDPEKIQLTAQQLPVKFEELFGDGRMRYNACSLHQLNEFGKMFPGREVSVRINPGLGSGSNRKTNVGGPSSSFGIWFEDIGQIREVAARYDLRISRIHSHIGSGTDAEVWKNVARMTLDWAVTFEHVDTVNLGGGFKVARMADEKSTCLQDAGAVIKEEFVRVFKETGRKLKLEIEPGTYIAANCGVLLSQVDDKISTGADGYNFLKLNTGMDAITRPALYASRHPLVTVSKNASLEIEEYVVTGHCCESGDVFTLGDGEVLEPRAMTKAEIGDLVVIEGTGAYCSSMNLRNYNSFPACNEVVVKAGEFDLVRKAETLKQILDREILPSYLK
jgi:diaminopimelate decarboxylase